MLVSSSKENGLYIVLEMDSSYVSDEDNMLVYSYSEYAEHFVIEK